MEKSESIKNLAAALCKFQGEVGKINKDAANPFYKSKYASLANILDVIREPLAANNLAFAQFPSGENELTTILMHSSGEYLTESYTMKPVKNDPQSLGSAITYQRRYAIGAILGLNIDEDDDGNKASGKTDKAQGNKQNFSYDLVTEKFIEKVAKAEADAAASGEHFSLLGFLERYYYITGDQAGIVQEKLNNYKQTHKSA